MVQDTHIFSVNRVLWRVDKVKYPCFWTELCAHESEADQERLSSSYPPSPAIIRRPSCKWCGRRCAALSDEQMRHAARRAGGAGRPCMGRQAVQVGRREALHCHHSYAKRFNCPSLDEQISKWLEIFSCTHVIEGHFTERYIMCQTVKMLEGCFLWFF